MASAPLVDAGVLFGNSAGLIAQDSTNFVWDDTNNNLRIGATSSGSGLTKGVVIGSGTPPTTAPADASQVWVADVSGAGTAAPSFMIESTETVNMGGVIKRQNTAIPVSGTTTQTTVFSHTVQGLTLGTNRILRLKAFGNYVNNSGGARDFTLRVKYGASTIYTHLLAGVASNALGRAWDLDVMLGTEDSTANQTSHGNSRIGTAGTATGTGGAVAENFTAVGFGFINDSAVDQTLSVTMQHNNTDTAATVRSVTVELL
jgi:hypothetical protein